MNSSIVQDSTRCQKIRQIFIENPMVEEVIRLYCESIYLKKDWDSISKRGRGKDWSQKEQWSKWVSKARENYNESRAFALESIEKVSSCLSEEQKEKLRVWIYDSPNSIAAYKKKKISAKDSVGLIEARVMHLLFISSTKKMICVKIDD